MYIYIFNKTYNEILISESDNESAPTSSPTKAHQRSVKVKTLEEIRLEKIQAESAAFYAYMSNNLYIFKIISMINKHV